MKIKNAILCTAVALISTFSLTANPYGLDEKTTGSTTVKEIKELIQDMDLDYLKLEDQTIKVQFMLNAEDEIIVLGTDDESLDQRIKSHLSYTHIKENDLESYKIYIVPVTFQVKGSTK